MARVLVIDDDADFRDYLQLLLERAGHAVLTLPNGAGIERLLAEQPVDAVITDLYMPDQDGIETVQVVRRLAPGMPVLAISGAGLSDDPCLRAMRMLGVAGVIAKPVRGPELLASLTGALAAR